MLMKQRADLAERLKPSAAFTDAYSSELRSAADETASLFTDGRSCSVHILMTEDDSDAAIANLLTRNLCRHLLASDDDVLSVNPHRLAAQREAASRFIKLFNAFDPQLLKFWIGFFFSVHADVSASDFT